MVVFATDHGPMVRTGKYGITGMIDGLRRLADMLDLEMMARGPSGWTHKEETDDTKQDRPADPPQGDG